MLAAYFDGGARPTNPGHGALGVLVKDETGEVIASDKRYLGANTTNNEAEWQGFVRALELGVECVRKRRVQRSSVVHYRRL